MTREELDRCTGIIVDAALVVHRELGPGLLLPYLRLGDRRVGLLINFHVPLLKDGIKRLVNNF